MRWIACWAAAGCLLAAYPGGAAGAQGAQDPIGVARSLVADINTGQGAAAAALFAEGATWTDGPAELLPPGQPATAAGRAEIAARLALLTAGHGQLALLGTPSVSGEQVRLKLRLTEDSLGVLGLSGVDLDTVAVVRDGLIASVANTVTPASVEWVGGALANLGVPLPKTGASPLGALLGSLLLALAAALAWRWRPLLGRR